MKRIVALVVALSAVFSGIAAPRAEEQTVQNIVGTWTLVSATIQASDVKIDLFGPDPSGRLMFGGDGRYTLIFLRRDLPKLASNVRQSQTADESRSITKGSIAHFGTYRVDEAGKFIVFRIEGSTFPNWTGAEQRRPFSLAGDELTYISPGSTGVATQVVVRRAK